MHYQVSRASLIDTSKQGPNRRRAPPSVTLDASLIHLSLGLGGHGAQPAGGHHQIPLGKPQEYSLGFHSGPSKGLPSSYHHRRRRLSVRYMSTGGLAGEPKATHTAEVFTLWMQERGCACSPPAPWWSKPGHTEHCPMPSLPILYLSTTSIACHPNAPGMGHRSRPPTPCSLDLSPVELPGSLPCLLQSRLAMGDTFHYARHFPSLCVLCACSASSVFSCAMLSCLSRASRSWCSWRCCRR